MRHGAGFHPKGKRKSLVRPRHERDIIQSNCCYGERMEVGESNSRETCWKCLDDVQLKGEGT